MDEFFPHLMDASFDPRFQSFPGTGVIPTGPQDFTQGPIAYTFNLNGNIGFTHTRALT